MEPKINKLTHYCIRVIHQLSVFGQNNKGYTNYILFLELKSNNFFDL